jgi:hypothetical protein
MLRAVSIGFLGLVLAFGVGCAKSPEEKAKSQADDAIASLKKNANSLDAMGTPKGTWTEGELNNYESLLNALEGDIVKVESMDGKDGVIITGSWSLIDLRRIIRHNRGVLSEAHSARGKRLKAEKHDQYRDLQAQDLAELQKLGDPSITWPREKLVTYIGLLEKIESRQREMDSIRLELRISQTPLDFWQNLNGLKARANQLLNQQAAS